MSKNKNKESTKVDKKKKCRKKNKVSVTETSATLELEVLHGMITRGYSMKIDSMLQASVGKDGDPMLDIDDATLDKAGKWISYNKITKKDNATESLQNKEEELKEIRERMRGKISGTLRVVGGSN